MAPLERIGDRHQRIWGIVSHLKVRVCVCTCAGGTNVCVCAARCPLFQA